MSGKGDVFLGSTAYPGKPKGLLDAVSEIQQYYVVERSGSTIPDDFLTFGGKLAFFEVGFKSGFVSGLIAACLTPFAIGVIEKYIPIFGSTDPSLFDRIFAFVLALSFSAGYAFFFAHLGKYYIGGISTAAIRNLISGVIAGALLKMLMAFIGFHFAYFVLLEPDRLAGWLLKLQWLAKYDALNATYQWLLDFRPVLLISAYFVVFTTLFTLAVPLAGIFLVSRKMKRLMEQEATWK